MADEDIDTVEVSAEPVTRKIKKPPSAWKAALLGLPGGPFVALGFGLAQHFRNKSYLENEAVRQVRDRDEKEQLTATLDSEDALADDDEKRMIKYLRSRVSQGYMRIAEGDRAGGTEMINHATGLLEELIGKDMQARKEEVSKQHDFQRQLVGDAAKSYRQEYQNVLSDHNSVMSLSQQVLDLTADKDFDPNKPANKAVLAELLSMGGAMFKDTPDAMEGIAEGVSAFNNVAGGIVGGIATIMKSQDFKMTPEDYNRLALNMQKYATAYAKQRTTQLGAQAGQLDQWGKKVGVLEQDYSLGDYVSGGEKELRFMPNPKFTGGHQPSEEDIAREQMIRDAATQSLIQMKRGGTPYIDPTWNQRHGTIKRPTN